MLELLIFTISAQALLLLHYSLDSRPVAAPCNFKREGTGGLEPETSPTSSQANY